MLHEHARACKTMQELAGTMQEHAGAQRGAPEQACRRGHAVAIRQEQACGNKHAGAKR